MLKTYSVRGALLECGTFEGGAPPPDTVWFDLIRPTSEEDRAVEHVVGTLVPTREEMQEIEPSSRLYTENGSRYMTAAILYGSDGEMPRLTPVTFILGQKALVTVRYEEPRSFDLFSGRVCKLHDAPNTPEGLLVELLETIVDRAADILERVAAEIDIISSNVFSSPASASRKRRYQDVMRRLGQKGDLLSKVRESLSSLGRLVQYLASERAADDLGAEKRQQCRTIALDITSLADHAMFLINKVTFLLDAVVGLVSIDQNEIIKLFAVISVVLMPPTLIASVYGMNFEYMPELHWQLGYPMALTLMVLSAILPYAFFKWKRWL